MRYKIWPTLIICGTILVLAPPLSDYLDNYRVSQMLIERKDINRVSFNQAPMSSEYRFGCWALGGAMVLIGTIGGWREDAAGPDNQFVN
jgi:hypothetical protein